MNDVDEAMRVELAHDFMRTMHLVGFLGGVLLAVGPGGRLIIVSSLDIELQLQPSALLRAALSQLEARERGEAPVDMQPNQ